MSYVTVYDGRTDQPTGERFDWPTSFIIEFCNETSKTLDQIRRGVEEHSMTSGSELSIEAAVSMLLAKRLLVEDKGRHFTLALPVNPNL